MATETTVVSGLEPRSFWGHFEALTKVPDRLGTRSR